MNETKHTGTALARLAQNYVRAQGEVEKVCITARMHLPENVPDSAIPAVLAAIATIVSRVPSLSAPKRDTRKLQAKLTQVPKAPAKKASAKPVLSAKATARIQSNARFNSFLKFIEIRGVSNRFLPSEAAEATKMDKQGVGGVLSQARKRGLIARESDGNWKVLRVGNA